MKDEADSAVNTTTFEKVTSTKKYKQTVANLKKAIQDDSITMLQDITTTAKVVTPSDHSVMISVQLIQDIPKQNTTIFSRSYNLHTWR